MTNNIGDVKDSSVLKEYITKNNKILNNLFNLILLFGSLAFLVTGIFSYFNSNNFTNINSTYIIFYPQGLTMCFYGITGTIISINLIINEYNKLGEGYNEFNKKTGEIKIYRKRNINNDIYIKYKIKDIVCKQIMSKN